MDFISYILIYFDHTKRVKAELNFMLYQWFESTFDFTGQLIMYWALYV